MQAIVAAAIALDALYAAVKERVEIPEDQTRAWRENGTARWKQMAEVFRRGFNPSQEGFQNLRDVLSEISKYRGWAVHPPATFREPILREEIERGVEWRFMAFRHYNARETVRITLSIISQLAQKGADGDDPMSEYSTYLESAVAPLVERWEEEYPDLPV